MDKHLEEQLERVRQLSARVAQIHEDLHRNTELMARDRERLVRTPLNRVRDCRPWPDADATKEDSAVPAWDEPAPACGADAQPRRRRR